MKVRDEVAVKWSGKGGVYQGKPGLVTSIISTARGRERVYVLTEDPAGRRPGYKMMLLLDARTEVALLGDDDSASV